MTSGILDQLLAQLDVFIITALPFLRPDAFYLFNTFIVLTIVFAGVWLAFGVPTHNVQFIIKKILLFGFFAFLVNNWLPLTDLVIQTFAKLGLKAAAGGGNAIAISQLFSPSSIVNMGTAIADQLFAHVDTLLEVALDDLPDLVITMFAAIIVIISFVIVALQLMIALIEFKLVTLAGFVLLPFALFGKTTFLAERVIGYVFSAGLKIFVLAVVVSFAVNVIPGWSVGPNVNIDQSVGLVAASLLMLGLSIAAPSAASALITGGPSLGVGSATAAATTAGSIGAAAGLATAGVAGAGAKAAGSAASSIEKARAAAKIDNLAPLPGSQALRRAGVAPGSSLSGSASGGSNPSSSNPGQNRRRMGTAGLALAGALPRGGDGGGGMSADLKGE